MTRPLYEPTAIAAAKIIAKHQGHAGKVGGWIYDSNDRPIVQGWSSYATNAIAAVQVTDPRTGNLVTRYAINWRRVR